ncbi:transcriptional regulator [Alkalispirochaeta americana]|uniref:Transcriptional regulator n=1 Tax=Alkalispirochaeta americana TaxID=159291 RepID=A0A1N6SIX0_9SPIO|nr:LuxR family transcriptional regulator [Alkalispirochaeta americana]SIQ41063.1 transcriptional regulator [Alkalispirochaeta americana]
MLGAVPSFVEDCLLAASPGELLGRFAGFIKSFGFDQFMIGDVSCREPHQMRETALQNISNYPSDWLDRYVAAEHYDHDPVCAMARIDDRPFTWKEAAQRFPAKRSQLVMEEAREFSIVGGAGFSIYRPRGIIIGFGLASSAGDMRTDRAALAILKTGAVHFQTAYSLLEESARSDGEETQGRERERSPRDLPLLTAREREVLLWLSWGKSKNEVADLLTVSESCIKRHCENIFKKLGTASVVESVARAVHLGVVNPF